MPRTLDPLLPEAEVDLDRRPAVDWPVDPWDNADRAGSVERLRRQTRPLKWMVYATIAVTMAVIIAAGGVGWWYLEKLNPAGDPGDRISFTVAEGETLDSLAERLTEEGFVSDAEIFKWYVERGGGLEITPGYYELRPSDHMGNVLAVLRTPPGQTYSQVTFPEGLTIEQMGRRLESSVERMTAKDFGTAAVDPTIRSLFAPEGVTSLEGLVFPDTYQVSNADSEAQLLDRMIQMMERVGNQEDIISKSALLGRTPYEMLIIASMIEKEAKVAGDRAKISRVIHNRLAISAISPDPFPLQIDASVLYGRSQLGIDTDLPFSELRQIESPWNTYLLPGLPATPIANPGRASIEAALNPAPNPSPGDPICKDLPEPSECFYLFYVLADEDGTHVFAATGEQHLANVAASEAAGPL